MRILIVDHETQVAKMLAESVRRQGHEAIVAGDDGEALGLLEGMSFHGMFLEIAMPKVSGLEFLRTVRETHPDLPVIIITRDASTPEIAQAWHLGVLDVIEKPLGLRNLTQALPRLEAAAP